MSEPSGSRFKYTVLEPAMTEVLGGLLAEQGYVVDGAQRVEWCGNVTVLARVRQVGVDGESELMMIAAPTEQELAEEVLLAGAPSEDAWKKSGMTRDVWLLYNRGFLRPDESRMNCAYCGLPVMLEMLPDTPEKQKARGRGVGQGTIWGEDVDVICWCCSFNDCEHKPHRSASKREPAIKLVGEEK